MTMLNTDIPGVTVEVTDTVNYGPQRPAQVRLQAWVQYDDPDNPGAHLIDLRFTPEQAMQLGHALLDSCVAASISNAK
jgi:hypothetical protein